MKDRYHNREMWDKATIATVWSVVNEEKSTPKQLQSALDAIDAISYVKSITPGFDFKANLEPFKQAAYRRVMEQKSNRSLPSYDEFEIYVDVDLDAKENGFTSLIMACIRGHQEIAIKLIDAKASLDIQHKKSGLSPLICACNQKLESVVNKLIEAKANLNLQDNLGRTALVWTILEGNQTIAQKLIAANADIHVKDKEDYTALDYACLKEQIELQEEVFEATQNIGLTSATASIVINYLDPSENLYGNNTRLFKTNSPKEKTPQIDHGVIPGGPNPFS